MTPIVAVSLAPLILGILLTQVLRLNVKSFQGIYLLFVAGATMVSYFYMETGFIAPLIAGAVGALVMFLTMGAMGTRIRASDYALIEFGVGLFPWTIGLMGAISYSVVLAGFVVLIALRPKFKNPFKSNKLKR